MLGSQGVKVLAKATLGTVLLFGIASCSETLEHAVLVGVSEHLTEVFLEKSYNYYVAQVLKAYSQKIVISLKNDSQEK